MVPEGVTVVAALHTVGAPTLADAEAELDEDVPICGDKKADKARVARLIELIPGPARGQRRAAGDGADRRAADPDADLGQQPLQGARRDQAHRPARRRPLGLSEVRVALLAGGTGGAKLGAGMQEEIGADLTVIANTGDDVELLGVHVSPDPDLITYWLSGEIDAERGWGIREDTFTVFERLTRLGRARLVRPLRPRPRRLPLPAPVPRGGRPPDRRPGADRPRARRRGAGAADVRGAGADPGAHRRRAARAAGVPDRRPRRARGARASSSTASPRRARPPRSSTPCGRAEAIVIGPSNPVISIGPILAVPGMREAIAASPAPGRRGQPLRRRQGRQGPDRPLHGGARAAPRPRPGSPRSTPG